MRRESMLRSHACRKPYRMKRTDFRFFDRLRVRWAEVDMQKIVFNGHYLMYFDTAVAAYWRALAMPYHETMEQLQGDLFVRKAVVEYLGSARYDDRCDVGLRCGRIGNSSIQFIAALFRGETLLVHGELIYVFAEPATQTSRPVPPALREVFAGYERGEAMIDVALGDWALLGREAQALRHAVFVQEQGISAALDEDGADAAALHALVRNRFGMAVATGRLLAQADGAARIGRMAVHAALRGSGVGSTMLAALLDAAKARGHHEATLHAQASSVPFYRRAGFVERGAGFEVAGIGHQEMRRSL